MKGILLASYLLASPARIWNDLKHRSAGPEQLPPFSQGARVLVQHGDIIRLEVGYHYRVGHGTEVPDRQGSNSATASERVVRHVRRVIVALFDHLAIDIYVNWPTTISYGRGKQEEIDRDGCACRDSASVLPYTGLKDVHTSEIPAHASIRAEVVRAQRPEVFTVGWVRRMVFSIVVLSSMPKFAIAISTRYTNIECIARRTKEPHYPNTR